MQIAKKSKLPKIISGIAVTISTIALGWIFISRFWFWVSLEIIAAALVAVGCSGEWWVHHHPAGRKKKERDERHQIESRFIAMVSAGVIMELFVLGHSIREGVNLENKVSEANERASTNELAVAVLNSNNLVLRSNVVALELKLQPRIITQKQIRDFIFLTENIAKIPIRIGINAPYDSEKIDYAIQMRSMFNKAGFGTPDADTNQDEGICRQEGFALHHIKGIGITNYAGVVFCLGGSRDFTEFVFPFEQTNGFTRPVISESQRGDANKNFCAVRFVFNQIGIDTEGVEPSNWTNETNMQEVLVVPKL
jgi:hypothetical protein